MFELGARPHPPRALYRSYLAQSDVFVGIYWQRYGWVAPDMDISGLEDEFVLSSGMPRLDLRQAAGAGDGAPAGGDARPARGRGQRVLQAVPRRRPSCRDLLLDDLAVLLTERFEPSRRHAGAASGEPRTCPPPRRRSSDARPRSTSLAPCSATTRVRLVTLTGPGGTGKTRLAVEAARAQVDRFDDGVFFVDLSAERQPDEVFAAIARSLGMGASDRGSPLDALCQRDLHDRHMLLVLDNFEQVTAAGPGVVELLAAAARW